MKETKPPSHLRPETRRWWRDVLERYELEKHHRMLLQRAAEAWDRGEDAPEALAINGITFLDRFGCPRSRPEIAVERDSRIAFARLIRELDLDIDGPSLSRPPALDSNRRGMSCR